jgi:4-oxalocrotonate tautomerase
MPTVEVSMGEGRTLDQKRQMVEGITSVISTALSVPEQEVTIIIRESSNANWAKGGKLKCDTAGAKPAGK